VGLRVMAAAEIALMLVIEAIAEVKSSVNATRLNNF